jgi:hypothetical protein
MFQVTKRKSIWIISFFFLIALCAVMLSAQAENQQAIVISDTAPVDEEEGTCSLDALECKAPLLTHTKVQEFIATKEWKEIAPNQGIPAVRQLFYFYFTIVKMTIF